MNKARGVVEVASYVAIFASFGLIGWTYYRSNHAPIPAVSPDIEFKNVTEPPLAGYSYADHSETLILAIRTDCHFCENSLPFYKQLTDLERDEKLKAHVLPVMPDSASVAASFLRAAGIPTEGIFSTPLEAIKVRGTPTLLLLDSRGRVRKAWVGTLSDIRQKEVLAAIIN